ncbi:hypothetical protein C3L23_08925 [Nautilia sp. PV-1]|nr:hypothetical protein C3L23_08925 [Nautilia sp. PV-1]
MEMKIRNKVTLDIISDIHLDFYSRFNRVKTQSFAKKLIDSKRNKIFDILVIAGDIGHYNDDNVYLIELLSRYYEKVFITFGNHDLYLLSSKYLEKYNHNSFNRLKEFKEMVEKIDNVIFLDGQKVEYKGITFWGSGLWYEVNSVKHWSGYMNDARYIYDRKESYKIVFPYDYYPVKYNFNVFSLYEKELEKINRLDKTDIIISHMPPVVLSNVYDISNTYFFVPYGEEVIERVKPKMWIFGHIHSKVYKKFNGCELICNPLGYPEENEKFVIESIKVN